MARKPFSGRCSVSRLVALLYGHPLEVGGVETQLLSLVRRSDPKEWRFRIVGETRPPFTEQVQDAGAEILAWRAARTPTPQSLRRLLGGLRSVDLLHMHSPRALLFGRLVRPFVRLPSVLTVHVRAGAPGKLRHRMYSHIEGWLGRGFPDRAIFVSARALREAAGSPLSQRAIVIENGVGLPAKEDRLGTRRGLGVDDDAVVGICVARLDPQKDLGTLLDAISRLRRGVFWIVGEGRERGRLEARAQVLGLGERVRFLGSRTDVPALLQAADVFVLPSLYEGSSIALLEAMAARLPCVATDVGDNGLLLLGAHAGSVVPCGDSGALADALAPFLEDPGLRLRSGKAAFETVSARSDLQMVAQTLAVYGSVGPSGVPDLRPKV
jgi:glycosyltransferase involved in cell wall biosynthesis